MKDGVRKAIKDRQIVLTDLVHAIREYRKLVDQKPLTLQGSDYAHAVQELNKAIDRAEGMLLRVLRQSIPASLGDDFFLRTRTGCTIEARQPPYFVLKHFHIHWQDVGHWLSDAWLIRFFLKYILPEIVKGLVKETACQPFKILRTISQCFPPLILMFFSGNCRQHIRPSRNLCSVVLSAPPPPAP